MAEITLQYGLELQGERYLAREVRGREGVSLPFRIEVSFAIDEQSPLDPDAVLREEAALLLLRNGEERRITGIVTSMTRRATRRGHAGGGEVLIVLEPKLILLKHRVDIRVFRTKTVPEIVKEVMEGLGVTVENRLRGRYKRREYCVEFRESDLDFCHRLLEDEGIFYFIDEMGVVVLGDSTAAYDDAVGVFPFRHGSGGDAQEDAITAIGAVGTMTPGEVTLRDWNHVHPRLDMDVKAKGPQIGGVEWYDYPGEYEEPAEGQAKVQLRVEALRCEHHRTAGQAFAAALRPGAQFEVFGTPVGATDGAYVVTRLSHEWVRDKKGFQVDFEALPADVVFRPAVVTPAPVETNPLTGFVTGPAGADIHTNEWGYVKVHFPWDRLQPKDDNCSHWIPVLQDNTGHSSAISRTRWEVLCNFMEGDPDRPVVMGRVYNAGDEFYSPLPERKMRTALRSLVSPRTQEGETPANFIQLDDYAGAEAVVVHAQKDQNVVVLNNKREQIDSSESLQVKGHEKIKIGGNHTIQTKSSLAPDVNGNQLRMIGGNHSIATGDSLSETVDKDHKLTIGGNHRRQMGQADTTLVAKNLTEKIGAVVLEISAKTNMVQAEKTSTLLVGGAVIEVSKNNKGDMAGLGKIETVGGAVFKKAGKLMATRSELLRNTLVGGMFKVDSMKEMLIAGIEKLSKRALAATYDGTKTLTFKVGQTQVVLKDGRIEIDAADTIVIKTTAENNQASGTSTQI